MKENEIDCFDISDGKLVYTQNKVKQFIKELKKTSPKYILYNSPFDSWNFSPEERFVYVDKYIKENYKLDHNYLKWNILVIKN